MGSGIFIVGTDTGVGKTVVTAGLLHLVRQSGIDAVPMKPVQTGGELDGERLISGDLRFCLQTSGYAPSQDELPLMNPYCFRMASSPHLAAETEGGIIETDHIIHCIRVLQGRHNAVIVEGAGGLMVPLNARETMLDLVERMSLPTVIVARRGLGTINHTLLTLNALRSRGVEVLGIILNNTESCESEVIARSNADTIETFGITDILGSIDYIDAQSEAELQKTVRERFAESVPGWTLALEALGARA